ncbi:uncharacterized protein PSFLO_06420 [Pseudozyma flocculosa]|uniref:DAGKc domain-containing protein n=1 Tax=Pseudozyma flocculosa TaxID=84751 RepID=A0A5C3F922_9BASI|nr:uncharacterized protein PSFLO_06420 [Pseudozyma flocculosa]
MARTLHIVVNPHAGHCDSLTVLRDEVEPLLVHHGNSSLLDIVRHQTQAKDDGRRIGAKIRAQADSSSPPFDSLAAQHQVDVVVVGGDGTTNEIINGFFADDVLVTRSVPSASTLAPTLHLIPVPTGSANALYAACFPPSSAKEDQRRAQASSSSATPVEVSSPERILTHLVTSHALHAAILHDSETPEMRQSFPGTERFKKAFELNATRWTYGQLRLHPLLTTGLVSQYQPSSKTFETVSETVLQGPFVYLNALVTDRLEPHFVPAPFSSTFSTASAQRHRVSAVDKAARQLQRPPEAVDLVIIRPHRDPNVKDALDAASPGDRALIMERAQADFLATRLGGIIQAMYDGGKHVDLVYEDNQGTAAPIVEYLRTGGYSFDPAPEDERASLICLDGVTIPSQKSEVSVWGSATGRGRAYVWT